MFGPKSFLNPGSVKDAVKSLKSSGGKALVVAGGTMIHSLVARGLLGDKEVMINIGGLPLNYVRKGKKEIALGATTTFTDLLNNKGLMNNPAYGALLDALRYPPVQIRNMATVGGCICSSFTLYDVPIAFQTLRASVKAVSGTGSRRIPLDNFFKGYFESSLKPKELVTEVLVPTPRPRTGSSLLKLETNANDLAILNVGTSVTLDTKSRCIESRIIVGGGVGNVPVRATTSESKLNGRVLSEDILKEAGEAVAEDINPMSDFRASSEYRRAVCKVLLRRALDQAVKRASGRR